MAPGSRRPWRGGRRPCQLPRGGEGKAAAPGVLAFRAVRRTAAGPPGKAGRPGGPEPLPPPVGDPARWATLGEPSLPLPQFPGSVPTLRGCRGHGTARCCRSGNGKCCEGLLTRGQGLFDKVGLITLLVLPSVQSEEWDLNL